MEGLKRRLQLLVTRGIVSLVNSASALQMLQVKTIGALALDSVEHFEAYGFTSHPHPGAEAITLSAGGRSGHEIAICVADRQYRLTALEAGEVAIYDDLGHAIILHRDGINIDGGGHTIYIANCPQVQVTGGDVIADGISLKTHVHGNVQAGSADSGVPHA